MFTKLVILFFSILLLSTFISSHLCYSQSNMEESFNKYVFTCVNQKSSLMEQDMKDLIDKKISNNDFIDKYKHFIEEQSFLCSKELFLKYTALEQAEQDKNNEIQSKLLYTEAMNKMNEQEIEAQSYRPIPQKKQDDVYYGPGAPPNYFCNRFGNILNCSAY